MATAVNVNEVPVKALPQDSDPKKSVAEAAGSHPAIMEPKLDGWRILFKIDQDGHARSYTRTGNEQTGKMPAIEAELARALPPGTILDGEVAAFRTFERIDEDGVKRAVLTHDWGKVQEVLGAGVAKAALRSGVLTYVVFDLIAHGGIDARTCTYEKRRELLEKIFAQADFNATVTLIPQIEATEESYDGLLAGGYEGGMVKWLDAPYRSGRRGHGWFKMKAQNTVDVVVMGYKPGTPGSSFDGMVGAVEFGQHDENGILVHRGRCSGMDWDVRKDITANEDAYLGRVFEMAYMGVMPPSDDKPLGAFRHPQWKRWRDDKDAASVVIHNA